LVDWSNLEKLLSFQFDSAHSIFGIALVAPSLGGALCKGDIPTVEQ
jgi:hypothetical protein